MFDRAAVHGIVALLFLLGALALLSGGPASRMAVAHSPLEGADRQVRFVSPRGGASARVAGEFRALKKFVLVYAPSAEPMTLIAYSGGRIVFQGSVASGEEVSLPSVGAVELKLFYPDRSPRAGPLPAVSQWVYIVDK